jgi:hypothetical protein
MKVSRKKLFVISAVVVILLIPISLFLRYLSTNAVEYRGDWALKPDGSYEDNSNWDEFIEANKTRDKLRCAIFGRLCEEYWNNLKNDNIAQYDAKYKVLSYICSRFFLVGLEETDVDYQACDINSVGSYFLSD